MYSGRGLRHGVGRGSVSRTMSSCCCLSSGVTPTVQQQLEKTMGKTKEALPGSGHPTRAAQCLILTLIMPLPGTDVVVLLKGDGSMIYQHTTADVNASEAASGIFRRVRYAVISTYTWWAPVVVGLRRAARQLGDTLGQSR